MLQTCSCGLQRRPGRGRVTDHLDNAARTLQAILRAREPEYVWTVEVQHRDLVEPCRGGHGPAKVDRRKAVRIDKRDARGA